jgi:hypothetical protein
MSAATSELVVIARLNGDFAKNYGKLIGAVLYLRSISAAGGRTSLWSGLLFAILSAAFAWLDGRGLTWFR